MSNDRRLDASSPEALDGELPTAIHKFAVYFFNHFKLEPPCDAIKKGSR